jgi:hypothetical protein
VSHNADLQQIAGLGSAAMNMDMIHYTNNIMNMPAIHIALACQLLVNCTCKPQPKRYHCVDTCYPHICRNDKTGATAKCGDKMHIGGKRDM